MKAPKSSISRKNLTEPRSYVVRSGRITSSQKKSIQTLWAEYGIELEKEQSNFKKIFGFKKRILVEIGFGSGESLLYLAKNYKNFSFLGIEVYLSGIGSVLRRAKKQGIQNLKIINGDAQRAFENFIEKGSIEAIIIFHPDPWPKRKHHKRRLLNESFIENIHKALKKGGCFYIKTDWQEYSEIIQKKIEESQNWSKMEEGELPSVLNSIPNSKYEIKALERGEKVRALIYKKN